MKSHWLGVAALAFFPCLAGAQSLRTTITADPVTGAPRMGESTAPYYGQSGTDLPLPVERPGYGARHAGEYERDLSAMRPAPADDVMPTDDAMESDIAVTGDGAVNDDLLTERRAGGITYITGGVGHAERDALNAMRERYNFKLTNAEAGGAFVSYTRIALSDAKGRRLLNAEADPIFLAQLPPGGYTLRAEREGQVKNERFQVKPGKPVLLQLRWM